MSAAKLREAAARGSTKEVLRLIEDGAKVLPDEVGRNALHVAAAGGHADVVAALLLAGCDVNVTDGAGCTALQHAAADGHLEVVRQLIQHGADVNHQDSVHGNTALHEASWKGFSRSVAALGRARAHLHLKNCGGFAALHLCCQNGHNQSCRELLLAGCSPNLQNNYGDTALHTSARYGHAGVTRILISANCRVSDQNKNGDTALHIAAAMGRRKLTRILLEAGCDRSLKNKQNETAQDIAARKDLGEILALLTAAPGAASGRGRAGAGGAKSAATKGDKKREKNESGTSSKDSSGRHKDKKKHKNEHGAHKVHFEKVAGGGGGGGGGGGAGGGGGGRHWSPYGCHYFPDPRAFPQPNLDSLPHEPLKRGEQYYLDLAGNIRKGPVGVGYTCYCAPFFRHMEARLDRDKQELKQHIDQAHQRLDQKVSSLERRTQGRLSELTRCVAAERALCEQRHARLAQWLARGDAGRRSERAPPRPRALDDHADAPRRRGLCRDDHDHDDGGDGAPPRRPPPVARARSLELLLDADDDGGAGGIGGGFLHRAPRPVHMHALAMTPMLHDPRCWRAELRGGAGENAGGAGLQRSCDALLERPPAPRRPPAPSLGAASDGSPRPDAPRQRRVGSGALDRSFDVLVGDASPPSPTSPAAPTSPAPQPRPRASTSGPAPAPAPPPAQGDAESVGAAAAAAAGEWAREQPGRRSVHEMVAQFQSASAASQQLSSQAWRRAASAVAAAAAAARGGEVRGRLGGDDDASESSEGEDDAPTAHAHGHADGGGPDYENVAWHGEDRRLQALPFRSRAGVYSPSPPSQDAPPDLHNDSGYSTRLYGSSKGPSPALSGGHIECDSVLPPSATAHALYGAGPGPGTTTAAQRATPRGRYDEDPSSGATVVTASLV